MLLVFSLVFHHVTNKKCFSLKKWCSVFVDWWHRKLTTRIWCSRSHKTLGNWKFQKSNKKSQLKAIFSSFIRVDNQPVGFYEFSTRESLTFLCFSSLVFACKSAPMLAVCKHFLPRFCGYCRQMNSTVTFWLLSLLLLSLQLHLPPLIVKCLFLFEENIVFFFSNIKYILNEQSAETMDGDK